MRIFAVGVAWLSLVSAAAAAPIFDGSDVQATAYFPNLPPGATTVGGPVVATVGPGIEFSSGQFGAFFGPSFDFSGTTITITHAQSAHQPATFNGYEFFDLNGTIDDIVGVSVLSDSTGFFSGDPSRVFFDANNIFVNFQGLNFGGQSNPTIVLGVQLAAVPEPASLLAWGLLTGVGLVGYRLRRRKVAV